MNKTTCDQCGKDMPRDLRYPVLPADGTSEINVTMYGDIARRGDEKKGEFCSVTCAALWLTKEPVTVTERTVFGWIRKRTTTTTYVRTPDNKEGPAS